MKRGLRNVLAVKATAAARGLLAEVDNADPIAPILAFGDLTVGVGVVKSSSELLAGATDADGDLLVITSVNAASGGTVAGTGPWTITPTATGAGSAIVVITDGRGGSVSRTVTWNGVAANANPVAPPSPVALGPIVIGEPIVIAAAQLLSGASDIDGDALSVTSLSVTAGSGTITGTGPWVFAASAAGDGVISYTISDGRGGTATGTITYNAAENLWVHGSVTVSGGSQILGPQRYRVYSPDGAFASAQFNGVLSGKNGLQYRIRLEIESFAAGTQLIMGDDVGNDIVITDAGVKVGIWTVNGPTAMIKRQSGHTDAIVKDVYMRAV